MIKYLSIFIFTVSYAGFDFKKLKDKAKEQIQEMNGGLSDGDIVSGLKEALSIGSSKASDQLHQENGFLGNPLIRIPFPENVNFVAEKMRKMGFGKKVDEFETSLNRAAEKAAVEAKPIFLDAIKSMSFSDAKKILQGSDNEATQYLQNTTTNPLTDKFTPHIKNSLESVGATKHWSFLAETYNKIPFVKNKADTDLPRYTTGKALTGMFTVVGEEEKNIRKDPVARTTDILKKVFGNKD